MSDGDLLRYRQVNPTWLDEDRVPSSQTFKPTPKDAGRLSVSRGELTDAATAYRLFTSDYPNGRGLQSVGVLAVSEAEILEHGLKTNPDPLEGPPPDPAHGVISFLHLGTSQTEKIAKKLKRKALDRGWAYAPPEV